MKAAVYNGTRNLYADMIPAVKSLLINSDVERVYLLTEDDDFPYPLPDCVETINVEGQKWFRHDGPNCGRRWTWMSMMRPALCHVFPELDRILFLDVDTIVLKDISDLWDLPIDECYFAASMEPLRTTPNFLYTNCGVCLLNLEKLRDGKADQIIHALNTKSYRFMEQDAMNEYCQGKIFRMPCEYNSNEWVEPCEDPKLIHFAGILNWNGRPEVAKFREISWSEIRGGL